jgi:hypothetical protein
MGGFNAADAYELTEHTCGRNNTTHEGRRAELFGILDHLYNPETEDLNVQQARLQVVLKNLQDNSLWKRFHLDKDLDREKTLVEILPFCHDEEEEKSGCKGCDAAHWFYVTAPMMFVRALAEGFEIPMRVEQPPEEAKLCEDALDRIDREMNIALNIGLHAAQLAEE